MPTPSPNPNPNPAHPSRRDALRALGLAAAAPVLPAAALASRQPTPAAPARPFRVAMMTDWHVMDPEVMPSARAAEGVKAALAHLRALDPKPDLVLSGGDLVHSSMSLPREVAQRQFLRAAELLREGCPFPLHHVIGNHDIWGWNRERSGATGAEPEFGRRWFMDTVDLREPARAIDAGGWRFILLDSIVPDRDAANAEKTDGSYVGRYDEAQYQWLEATLKATPAGTPVAVVTHMPLLSAGAWVHGATPADAVPTAAALRESFGYVLGRPLLHMDAHRVIDLFSRHPAVRLCLSGHIHTYDKVVYQGVTHLCAGAVCGAWWLGPENDRARRARNAQPGSPERGLRAQEGFVVLDLSPDGAFAERYETFAWDAGA